MEFEKLSKEALEDIIYDIMEDLKKSNESLYMKYEDMINEELYCIEVPEAIEIVKSMKPNGEVFSMSDVSEILSKYQTSDDKFVKYYLCMNMFYNDYKTYAEAKRLDIKEFCFEMSKLFINDVDGVKYKVEKYFKNF